VGRLQAIIDRNKHPYRRRGIAVEIPAILLLIVLGLLVFTNLASPPEPEQKPAKSKTVRDVPLMRAPHR
jgi:hypothetical protein